jgi:thioredoxin-dependent peroxiredoxin
MDRTTFLRMAGSALWAGSIWAAGVPVVGDSAPDFTLSHAKGDAPVRLSEVNAKSKVILVVLRGYPGYQCPYCNRQAQDFIRNATQLAGYRVIMVYPGPAAITGAKAQEFLADKAFPSNFDLLIDPDYRVTSQYGLRWDAPGETAYPSAFVLNEGGKVMFAKVSRSHGDRLTAQEIVAATRK